MPPLLEWARDLIRRRPWTPLHLPRAGFDIVTPGKALEEERLDELKTVATIRLSLETYLTSIKWLGRWGLSLPPLFGLRVTFCMSLSSAFRYVSETDS